MPKYSHIYVEKRAREYDLTQRVLDKFSRSIIVEIDDYTAVFNRTRQDWRAQKLSPKLIIAKECGRFLYPIGDMVPNLGYENFFYTSPVINCLYDCHYCFLQGKYASGNTVLFSNQADFFAAVDEKLAVLGSMHLSISYESDLLAYEGIFSLCHDWIKFSESRESLELEIRSKSANFASLKGLAPNPRVTLTWSLSPAGVVSAFETATPTIAARIASMAAALEHGWPIRVCFDPVLTNGNWQEAYRELIDELTSRIDIRQVKEICVGTFRMNGDQFRRLARQRATSSILRSGFERKDGFIVAETARQDEVRSFFERTLGNSVREAALVFQG